MSDLPEPSSLLAHRDPFLFVDELIELVPGKSVSATWALTGNEAFFAGHFPGRPTLPGVLMIEALAQTGACGLLAEPSLAGKLPLLAGTNKVKFRRQVVPGDTLRMDVEITQLSGRAGKGTGRASVGDELACQLELMFVLADS